MLSWNVGPFIRVAQLRLKGSTPPHPASNPYYFSGSLCSHMAVVNGSGLPDDPSLRLNSGPWPLQCTASDTVSL